MLSRDEFLSARRRGIGGSDVAPILGMSPWKTPLDVWREKRGEQEPQAETDALYWGRVHEPRILEEYSRRTGRALLPSPGQIVSPSYDFAIANVDGITRCGRIVEAKTSRYSEGWGEDGSDQVPEAYALQVQHYMLVTGLPVADIAVLIAGSDFRTYSVEADRELHEMLVDAESEFWKLVIDGTPPEPRTYEDAARLFTRPAEARVEADDATLAAWRELLGVRAQLAALEAEEDRLRAQIASAIGDRGDTLVYGGSVLATWKATKGSARFDTSAFKAAHPDIYTQFTKAAEGARRLLLKDKAAA